jgi:hypothetical protein
MSCSFCLRNNTSHLYKITRRTKAGNQNWSSLVGSVLCHACYSRFRNGGKLARSTNKSLAASERFCTYIGCKKPYSSCHFYTIEMGKSAGGQDWSEIQNSVLCHACYKQFLQRGTLERPRTLLCEKTKQEKSARTISCVDISGKIFARPRRKAASTEIPATSHIHGRHAPDVEGQPLNSQVLKAGVDSGNFLGTSGNSISDTSQGFCQSGNIAMEVDGRKATNEQFLLATGPVACNTKRGHSRDTFNQNRTSNSIVDLQDTMHAELSPRMRVELLKSPETDFCDPVQTFLNSWHGD